jgi:F-type H+-transporting ATPase subunit delta
MNDKAEKIYAEAFFELCTDESDKKAEDVLEELTALDGIFTENVGFTKLMGTPTVPMSEKIALMKEIAESGNISEICTNLLCVLVERNRFGCFNGIVKNFRRLYNDYFKIAEITVTANAPLSEEMREKISAKMAEVTGNTKISITEKVDPSVIGGIIIDYGSTRYDGSVRARLNALKNELGSVIA